MRSHNLLRVMESIRETEEHEAVQRYYWELGRRIHHDRDFLNFDLNEVLDAVGVNDRHLAAYEDPSFDEEIRTPVSYTHLTLPTKRIV